MATMSEGVADTVKQSISTLANPNAWNLLVVISLLVYFGIDTYIKETRNDKLAEYLLRVEANRHEEIKEVNRLLNTCIAVKDK